MFPPSPKGSEFTAASVMVAGAPQGSLDGSGKEAEGG